MSQEYTLILRGSVSMLPWQMSVHANSKEHAIAYCQKALEFCPAAGQAMSADLFDIKSDQFVKTFYINRRQEVTQS